MIRAVEAEAVCWGGPRVAGRGECTHRPLWHGTGCAWGRLRYVAPASRIPHPSHVPRHTDRRLLCMRGAHTLPDHACVATHCIHASSRHAAALHTSPCGEQHARKGLVRRGPPRPHIYTPATAPLQACCTHPGHAHLAQRGQLVPRQPHELPRAGDGARGVRDAQLPRQVVDVHACSCCFERLRPQARPCRTALRCGRRSPLVSWSIEFQKKGLARGAASGSGVRPRPCAL